VHSKSHMHVGAFGLALSVLGLAACNTLLGLDGYREGTNVIIQDAGMNVDALVVDASGDAEPEPPVGTRPASWAQWRMPHTGSPTDRFYGVYTTRDGGVSIQVKPDGFSLYFASKHGAASSFSEAVAYCNGIAQMGDYRLPTRIELITLLNYDALQSFDAGVNELFPTGMLGYYEGDYWTASIVRPNRTPVQHWLVNGKTGVVSTGTETAQSRGVVCIKDKP
jgi:hypothetical protein